MTAINAYVIPTGGAIGVQLTGAGDWTLSRAVSGVTGLSGFTQIGSGTFPVSGSIFFLDAGEGLPAPLAASGVYLYQFTDENGTVQSAEITPVASVDIQQDGMTAALIRLIQGFIASLVTGGKPRPQVLHAMPLTGWPPLPLIVVYPELAQQAEVPIGKDVANPDDNNIWVNSEFADRVYRVSVIASNAVDREFYRDAVIAFFKVGLSYFLSQIGQDVRQRWQAASYQVTGDNQNLSPGFYGCDITLEITGIYNISVTTTYGVISTITGTATSSFNGETATITAEVPS